MTTHEHYGTEFEVRSSGDGGFGLLIEGEPVMCSTCDCGNPAHYDTEEEAHGRAVEIIEEGERRLERRDEGIVRGKHWYRNADPTQANRMVDLWEVELEPTETRLSAFNLAEQVCMEVTRWDYRLQDSDLEDFYGCEGPHDDDFVEGFVTGTYIEASKDDAA